MAKQGLRFASFSVLTLFCAVFLPHAVLASVIFKDDFSCIPNGGLITSDQYYSFTNFPYGGTSTTNNPSRMGDGYRPRNGYQRVGVLRHASGGPARRVIRAIQLASIRPREC